MSQTQTFTVTGMTCGHCVASVTEEVQEVPGVQVQPVSNRFDAAVVLA